MEFEVATIGERGQIVIPQSLRDEMSLRKGDKFMVLQRGDMLIFKKLRAPSLEDFENLLKRSHSHASKHNFIEDDLQESIKRARRK